jgi:hypothetical protein
MKDPLGRGYLSFLIHPEFCLIPAVLNDSSLIPVKVCNKKL